MSPGVTYADVDRRIEIISGLPEQSSEVRRVSDLRPLPFVVLLGEPGMGKSTVFEREARLANASVLKVRGFIRLELPPPLSSFFSTASTNIAPTAARQTKRTLSLPRSRTFTPRIGAYPVGLKTGEKKLTSNRFRVPPTAHP